MRVDATRMHTEFPRLLEAARRGDRAAWGLVLESFRSHLLVLARQELNGHLRSKADPADLVQQTFLEAIAPPARGDTPAELRGWLTRMLRNNVCDFVARYRNAHSRRVDREVPLDDTTMRLIGRGVRAGPSCPATGALEREAREALTAALPQLSAGHRQVLHWRHGENLRFAEIGQRLGLSENAARKLYVRAIAHLRKSLGADHEAA